MAAMGARVSLPNYVAVAFLSLAIAQTSAAAAAAAGTNPVPDTSRVPVQTLGTGHVPVPTLGTGQIAAAPDAPGSNPLDRPIVAWRWSKLGPAFHHCSSRSTPSTCRAGRSTYPCFDGPLAGR